MGESVAGSGSAVGVGVGVGVGINVDQAVGDVGGLNFAVCVGVLMV